MDKELIKKAKYIAGMIKSVDSDFRGELFLEVSEQLKKDTQYFTASCIKIASDVYLRDE